MVAAPDDVLGKFTGKERDAETGLDFFGARYMWLASAITGLSVKRGAFLLTHNTGDFTRYTPAITVLALVDTVTSP